MTKKRLTAVEKRQKVYDRPIARDELHDIFKNTADSLEEDSDSSSSDDSDEEETSSRPKQTPAPASTVNEATDLDDDN